MTPLLMSRYHFRLFTTLLLGILAGCSKHEQPSTAADPPPPSDSQMPDQPKHGFREYVKNPELFREEMQEKANAAKAAAPTETELAQLVSVMRSRPLTYQELQKLKLAGKQAVPLLVEALRDEKFLLHHYGKSVSDGLPMETVLNLLEPFRLPEARVLSPALKHPDERIQSRALYHLARCGNDDAIEALQAGLKSDSEDCRTWTLMGLAFLKDSPRGSKQFRTALFEAVVPLLNDKEHEPAQYAPRTLLALDLDKAQPVLMGRDILRPDNESAYKALQALKDAGLTVPGPQLRELLAGLKGKAMAFPFDRAYAEGLILLARAEGERAKDLIADAEKWGNENVRAGAAEALEIAAGVANAYQFVLDKYRQNGAKGLTEPQLYYLTLCWLDAEVRNGGFSQFYFNSSGELAPYAVKAAQAVGAPKLAAIIQQANSLFGKDGPHTDREQRMAQLSKIDFEVMDKLNSPYYACEERLRELLPKYVAANATAFKPPKQ